MQKQRQQQGPEQLHRILFIHLNEYGYLEAKNRLVLTVAEVAEVLTLSTQKVRWMMLRGEIPSIHFGSRRGVSLDALEHYVRECEMEEQQERLDILKRYHGCFGQLHPEIQHAQEKLHAMRQQQGYAPSKEQDTPPVTIQATLYHITITDTGCLECTPRWLLSMQEAAQLLSISRATLYELFKQGDFPAFHIKKRVFVRVESLRDWIYAKEHPEFEQPTTVSIARKNRKSPQMETRRPRNL